MKKILSLLLLLLLLTEFSSVLYSYDLTRTRLYLSTSRGYKLEKLVFGINEKASNSLDTALGENEVPPFLPPEGMQAGFIIFDTTQQTNIMTYLDLRPYPKSDTSWVYHELDCLLNGGDVLTIKWNPIGPEIDSIFIIDLFTNGIMVNIDMKKASSITMPNEFIKTFLIKVKYPNKEIDVKENISVNDQIKFNNIVTDELKIDCGVLPVSSVKIVNNIGVELIIDKESKSNYSFDISNYSDGIYYFIINYTNSTSIIKKILKI